MNATQRYREIAELLTERLLAELKDNIHSIVLFGSVARGDASEESDIDILIIMDAPFGTKQSVHEISYDIDLDNEAVTQPVFFTTEGFEQDVLKLHSYLSYDVISQGVVLYDDGTYRRICAKAATTISGVPG